MVIDSNDEKYLDNRPLETIEDFNKIQQDAIDLKEKTKQSIEKINEERKTDINEERQTTIYRQLARDFYLKQPYFYDGYKLWWLWEINKWKIVDEVDIMIQFDKYFVQESERADIKSRILEALKKYGRTKTPIPAKNSWLQFNNIIVDLETDEEIKPSPKYFVTNPIPWNLGDTSDTPIMDKLFMEWVNPKDYLTLNEVLAYSAYPHMLIHRIFALIGGGRNGKGQFAKVVEKYVGPDNVTTADIDLINTRFETNGMYRKLLCNLGEIDKGIFEKTKTLKGLSGDDLIRIEFKGKDKIQTRNYAKPLIYTQHLPETTDKTAGFYSRWTIIEFPNEFPEGVDIFKTIPDEEYENFARKSLEILKELFKRGTFDNDGTIKEREEKYESFSSPIDDYVKEYCDSDLDEKIMFSDFHQQYCEYLVNSKLKKASKPELSKILTNRGYIIKTGTVLSSNSNLPSSARFIHGLKWRYNTENI